jgi:hypothetical protein
MPRKPLAIPKTSTSAVTTPGEGERRALRGYTSQYSSSAAAIYASLICDDLEWVGLADRRAGIVDDLVLGLTGHIVGHQFKTSRFPEQFRLRTLLMGANGLLPGLAEGWKALQQSHPGKIIEIRLVTNDYPSTRDTLVDGYESNTAIFLAEFEEDPARSLAEWRTTRWTPLVNDLCAASGLDEQDFDHFLQSLRILYGSTADFLQVHRLTPNEARLVKEIAAVLPRLVADSRDKDRWTRAELLHELGWRDSSVSHHVHQFPVGAYVQRNVATEIALQNAIQRNITGYVSLVGPPGAGKSTLLQIALESGQNMFLVRYLAYVPDIGQGIGRGEADDFFDDIITHLKRTGLRGLQYRDQSLLERREQFIALLRGAGERFAKEGIRTLIVIDGLDHVPREERPHRSFLAELPLPGSIPDGVLFVLGTQRVNLDDIIPAVQDQAGAPDRMIVVESLAREAVHRMADLLGLDPTINRDIVFGLTRGHPLVTRYLIEALRRADSAMRDALLAGEIVAFDGDIEAVYESAWRGFREDQEARTVLDYLARAEGPMPPELLAQSISEQAVERAMLATRHLLAEGKHGWSVFHNSFRLFILSKPRERFGKNDPTYGKHVYQELAVLARIAPVDSPQHWLELRYLARAEEHGSVLALATPARFRQQLAERRSTSELWSDLRLAFISAKQIYDPLKVFQLLLISDEIDRRWSAFEDAPAVVEALLSVGDFDGAVAFVEQAPDQGYEVVDALLDAGETSQARAIFDKLEPLQHILSVPSQGGALDVGRLRKWAWRVVHFRDVDQILQAIQRLSKAAMMSEWDSAQAAAEELASELCYEVALAIVTKQNDVDIDEVGHSFGMPPAIVAELKIEAGIVTAERGAVDIALKQFRDATTQEYFSQVANTSRRKAALIAAANGDMQLAEKIFTGLQPPAIAYLDEYTDGDAPKHIARAVIEHAELAAMLERPYIAVPESKRLTLRPLQLHSEEIGRVFGLSRLDPLLVHSGEIARIARTALIYLYRMRPNNDEFYVRHQVVAAIPILSEALIQSAAMCGENEFSATIDEFDKIISWPEIIYSDRISLRREVAVGIYRYTGDGNEASLRLDSIRESLVEDAPAQQIEELSKLASSYAQVGNVTKAKLLLDNLADVSLGYAQEPDKDPQHITWCELLKKANEIDPDRRSDRTSFLLRQVTGMTQTAGRWTTHRIAAALLKEATMCDAQNGWEAGQLLVEQETIDWAQLVSALLYGLTRRRPELIPAAVVTWCELALPYYMEPYYHESELGTFIEAMISAALPADVQDITELYLIAIETESRAHERSGLLDRLRKAAIARGVWSHDMEDSHVRWKAESPPPRRSYTSDPYDNVLSLLDLQVKIEQDATDGKPIYTAPYAFCRLAPGSDFTLAKNIFDRWDSVQENSRARFTVINMAIDSGLTDVARTLMRDYISKRDDSATWTKWTEGSSLRYFQAKLRLEGAQVHKEAYDDFVESLAAGRVSIRSALFELDDIFPTIASTPDWAGMWDALTEQLATTREYALGSAFESDDSLGLSDEGLIVSIFSWAMKLQLFELHRHILSGALRLTSTKGGNPVFVQLVRRLLTGTGDEPAEGIQLLLLDTNDTAAPEVKSKVLELTDHMDYAIAESATVLARRWGLSPSRKFEEMPPFYSIILKDGDEFERPQLEDAASGAMLVEDPLGWTHAFENQIDLLTRSIGVSSAHIRYRCWMFIQNWGGINAFGKSETERLLETLKSLHMKLTYSRPHMVVATRALRYVAGELRRADAIPDMMTATFLHLMGYPAPRPPMILPMPRPKFIRRPVLDKSNWQTPEKDWLDHAADDTAPLQAGSDTIAVEVCEFHIRNSGRTFQMQRVRANCLELDDWDRDFDGFHLLPHAMWVGQVLSKSHTPAPTIACRLLINYVPEVPRFRLVICPHWLKRLDWHTHPNNELSYLDRHGTLAARIVWWRDGGPVDIEDEVIWGQGTYLILTPNGRKQIEAVMGPLDVRSYVRRSYIPESRDKAEKSRMAESRD